MLPGEFLLKQSTVTQYVLFGQSVLPELNGVVLLLLPIMSLPLFSMINKSLDEQAVTRALYSQNSKRTKQHHCSQPVIVKLLPMTASSNAQIFKILKVFARLISLSFQIRHKSTAQ
jgi:hypothetical protein